MEKITFYFVLFFVCIKSINVPLKKNTSGTSGSLSYNTSYM